jgi:hypothetical protein
MSLSEMHLVMHGRSAFHLTRYVSFGFTLRLQVWRILALELGLAGDGLRYCDWSRGFGRS